MLDIGCHGRGSRRRQLGFGSGGRIRRGGRGRRGERQQYPPPPRLCPAVYHASTPLDVGAIHTVSTLTPLRGGSYARIPGPGRSRLPFVFLQGHRDEEWIAHRVVRLEVDGGDLLVRARVGPDNRV